MLQHELHTTHGNHVCGNDTTRLGDGKHVHVTIKGAAFVHGYVGGSPELVLISKLVFSGLRLHLS